MLKLGRAFFLAVGVLGLVGCGGGGGGDDGVLISLTQTSINESVTDQDPPPELRIPVSVDRLPEYEESYYVTPSFNGAAVASVDVQFADITDIAVIVRLRDPVMMDTATYNDTVRISVCLDAGCSRPIAGSPFSITVSYKVTRLPPPLLTIGRDVLQVEHQIYQEGPVMRSAPVVEVPIGISGLSEKRALKYTTSGTGDAVISATVVDQASSGAVLRLQMANSALGTFTDDIVVSACLDAACSRPAAGSPKTLRVNYTVEQPPAPPVNRPALPTKSIKSLAHNVIDAEFSAALNAVVMVASYPSNALYVYDIATGSEQQLLLDKVPAAVSVGPSGLAAAVGHDALVTHVDLTKLATPASAKTLLNLTADTGDVVLAGNGWLYVFPATYGRGTVHAIKIDSNTETATYTNPGGNAQAKLHPSGKSIYLIPKGLSSPPVFKVDISNGPAASVFSRSDSVCSKLWLSELGDSIFTSCGKMFRTSAQVESDLLYKGELMRSPNPTSFGSYFQFVDVSESREKGQLSSIERERLDCSTEADINACRNYYTVHNSSSFKRETSYSLPPITVSGRAYAQDGLFTFYGADGSTRILLSNLRGITDPNSKFYLSVLD